MKKNSWQSIVCYVTGVAMLVVVIAIVSMWGIGGDVLPLLGAALFGIIMIILGRVYQKINKYENSDEKDAKEKSKKLYSRLGIFGILVILFIVIGFLISGGCSAPDVTHDPDGLGGYSDEFWEWWIKQ